MKEEKRNHKKKKKIEEKMDLAKASPVFIDWNTKIECEN